MEAGGDSAAAERLEIATALVRSGLERLTLTRPPLRRALDVELVGLAGAAPEAAREEANSVARRLAARLQTLEEAFRLEQAAPDLIVVALRSDLEVVRLRAIARAMARDDYALSISVVGDGSAESVGAPGTGVSGLNP
jgi:hypothetical protein